MGFLSDFLDFCDFLGMFEITWDSLRNFWKFWIFVRNFRIFGIVFGFFGISFGVVGIFETSEKFLECFGFLWDCLDFLGI